MLIIIVTTLPWIIAMTLPFAVAFTTRQEWKKRPLFVILGLLIAIVICWVTIIISTALLFPIYMKMGWTKTELGQQFPPYIYINITFNYMFNIGATYWLLRQIAPFFQDQPKK